METSSSWQVLQHQRHGTPRLLVKYHFREDGFQVLITDLSRIWEESLSKAECIQRATQFGSSIDASQDDEQLHILLDKIQSAFDHENGTTLELSSNGSDEGNISIDISATLPKPLAPLQWTLQLRLLDPSQLHQQLVAPLLNQAIRLQHQVEHLVGELQNKDRVISKVCDRLETSGNDLTTVFPGVSNIKTSRKRGQREQLANHVKGLGDFDEDAWRARSTTALKQGEIPDGEVNVVLSRLLPLDSEAKKESPTSWWSQPGVQSSLPSREAAELANGSHDHPMLDRNESIQDDEFQRQATPPHLRQPAQAATEDLALDPSRGTMLEATQVNDPKQKGQESDGSSTEDEDEDDLDAAPKARRAKSQNRQLPTSLSSAGESQAVKEQAKEEPPPPAVSRKLGVKGGPWSASQSPVSERPMAEVRTLGKLGTFGGKVKESTPVAMDGVALEEEQGNPVPAKSHKIGMFGGKKAREGGNRTSPEKDTPMTSQVKSPPRARTIEKQDTPPPRETSQERADKKRDQLKRELDEKAKAPVKKKRKF